MCLGNNLLKLCRGLVYPIGTQQIAGFQRVGKCCPLSNFTAIDNIIRAEIIGSAGKVDLCAVEKFKDTVVNYFLFVNLRIGSYEAFLIGNVAMKVGQSGPVDSFKCLSYAQKIIFLGINSTLLTFVMHQTEIVEIEVSAVPFVFKHCTSGHFR